MHKLSELATQFSKEWAKIGMHSRHWWHPNLPRVVLLARVREKNKMFEITLFVKACIPQ